MKKKIFFFIFVLTFTIQPNLHELRLESLQTQKYQKELQYDVAVVLKLVQVFVTDKKGNPARDLEKSDFILYDNSKLQEITDFEKHFLYVPEQETEESKPSPMPDTSSVMNRKFFFLIDIENNDLEGIAKSRNAAVEFIGNKAQPSDEIALLSYSSIRGLILHEYLTSDHQKVREAIEKIRAIPGVKGGWDSWAALGHSVMGMEAEKLSASVTDTESRSASLRFSSSIQDLAKALRHIPGQKNIILFSKGYGKNVLIRGSSQGDAFSAMGKELASSNSPVFSVSTITGIAKRKALPDGALDYLSKLTGGKSFHDVNYYSKIAEDIQNATSNYYVLGYSIESNWDGKFHDIMVEVKREGYKVHAQRGYFNPLPFKQLSPVEKHFQLLALALGENAYFEQHMNFPMFALPFTDKKRINTILISEIPVQRTRNTIGDNTEFILLIFDQNKTIVDSKRMEINWGMNIREKVFLYSAVSLAPGRYDCRIVIRNLDNGKGAVGACSAEVLETEAKELKLYPPLLLISGQRSQYMHVFGPRKDDASKSVSLFQVFPFQSKEYVPMIGELKQGVSSLYAMLRCIWAGDQAPEIQISAWLEPKETGQKIPLVFSFLRKVHQTKATIFFLEFEIPELQPGQHVLNLYAEDMATKSSSQTTIEFSISK